MAEMMVLKAKYRNPGGCLHRDFDPPEGTWVYKAGRFTSKKRANAARIKHASIAPRMRAYWGNVAR